MHDSALRTNSAIGERRSARHRRPGTRAVPQVILHIGDLHASRTPTIVKTLLGSCISACLFDATAIVGGMNHFLLPGNVHDPGLSTRYGINAMEVLINEMLRLGADRRRLAAKIFGGADIFRADHPYMRIGSKNIAFVREFLATERIPIVGERTGGHHGLILHYHPHTFDVLVKPVATERFRKTTEAELSYRTRITRELSEPRQSDITLF